MDTEDVIEMVDHASRMNDRWLFVALLCIFIISISLLVRWFMKRWDSSDMRVTTLQDRLDAVRKEHTLYLQDANRRLSEVVAANTEMIKQATHVIADNTEMSTRKLTILNRLEHKLEQIDRLTK